MRGRMLAKPGKLWLAVRSKLRPAGSFLPNLKTAPRSHRFEAPFEIFFAERRSRPRTESATVAQHRPATLAERMVLERSSCSRSGIKWPGSFCAGSRSKTAHGCRSWRERRAMVEHAAQQHLPGEARYHRAVARRFRCAPETLRQQPTHRIA